MNRAGRKRKLRAAQEHQRRSREERRQLLTSDHADEIELMSKDASVPLPAPRKLLAKLKRRKERMTVEQIAEANRPRRIRGPLRDTSIRALEGTRYSAPKARSGSRRRHERGRRGAHPRFKSKHGMLTNTTTKTY